VSPNDKRHIADVHVYLPILSTKGAAFKTSPALTAKRGQEFAAFIGALLGEGLPPALRRLRSDRVVHHFFGQWDDDLGIAGTRAPTPSSAWVAARAFAPAQAHAAKHAPLSQSSVAYKACSSSLAGHVESTVALGLARPQDAPRLSAFAQVFSSWRLRRRVDVPRICQEEFPADNESGIIDPSLLR
jgi:hypothetical protein